MDIIGLIDRYYKTHELTKQADLFIRNPSLLPDLVHVAVSDLPHPYPESTTWILTHIVARDKALMVPFQENMIDCILLSSNQSVLRNLLHVLSELPTTTYKEAEFLDRLMNIIGDSKNKVALFVYGLYNLRNFIKVYPEIISEIDAIIDQRSTEGLTPAMRISIRNFRQGVN